MASTVCACNELRTNTQDRDRQSKNNSFEKQQPAPRDHPWRTMPNHGMTLHTSGTSLAAQARYTDWVREILECWFDDKPIREEYLIVEGGKLAGTGAHSYSEGDATGGFDEAAKFKERTER